MKKSLRCLRTIQTIVVRFRVYGLFTTQKARKMKINVLGKRLEFELSAILNDFQDIEIQVADFDGDSITLECTDELGLWCISDCVVYFSKCSVRKYPNTKGDCEELTNNSVIYRLLKDINFRFDTRVQPVWLEKVLKGDFDDNIFLFSPSPALRGRSCKKVLNNNISFKSLNR